MDAMTIRKRLKAQRQVAGFSQQQLAEKLKFKDRQTLQAIESGERKLSAQELIDVANIFGVELDFFSDPFRLVGEGNFSWRQNQQDPEGLKQYEQLAGRWVATYRHLFHLKNVSSSPFLPKVGLNKDSTYEDACELGELIVNVFDLGDIPSQNLAEKIRTELGILILNVDAIPGVSGAACQLTDLNVIFVNRHEILGRRNFNLAHELFHLLTWDALPPQHNDYESGGPRPKRKHIEQLAENFAASLLMPTRSIERFSKEYDGLESHEQLNVSAERMGVTSQALKWRMVNMGLLSRKKAEQIPDALLVNNGKPPSSITKPISLFGHQFMEMLGWGVSQGHISVRKTATLLDMTIDDLYSLFNEHSISPPFEI